VALLLTFELLLDCVLVDGHDPASHGLRPESKRVEGPAHRARIAGKTVATSSATCTI
jgi:hypothetical protein